jgi:prophage regulatory protein
MSPPARKLFDAATQSLAHQNSAAVPPTWTVPAPTTALPHPDQLIRMPQVRELCPLSKPSLYRLIREGKFPAPVNLGGGRAVAWVRREVEAFVRERIEERAAERIGQVAAHDVSPP